MTAFDNCALPLVSLAIPPVKRLEIMKTLDQLIEKHLLNYDQTELNALVNAERTTYAELASAMKKDMERNFMNELLALAKELPVRDYFSAIMSIEGKILSRIEKKAWPMQKACAIWICAAALN